MKKLISIVLTFSLVLGTLVLSGALNPQENLPGPHGLNLRHNESKDIEEQGKPDIAEKVNRQIENMTNSVQKKFETTNQIIRIMNERINKFQELELENKEYLIEKMESRIENATDRLNEFREKLTKEREQMKEKVRNSYTDEEKEQIEGVANKLKKHADLKVLPFENIYARGRKLKFDIPPVIKQGRTLIPVRALAVAYGFIVEWDADNAKVTLEKEDKVIELYIDSMEAFVNDVSIELDVPAEIFNGRTVVPLRFIIESIGLNVKWDSVTETIYISDDEVEEINGDGLNELTDNDLDKILEKLVNEEQDEDVVEEQDED